MKQSIDRVLGEWERSSGEHLFGYLLGMSAFSLQENLLYALFLSLPLMSVHCPFVVEEESSS
jgi:hypothetical protein